MTFVASNGFRVMPIDIGHQEGIRVQDPRSKSSLRIYANELGALREYFANQESLSAKPWLGALEGELWAIETKFIAEHPCLVSSGYFRALSGYSVWEIENNTIESGHRIWPEDNKEETK